MQGEGDQQNMARDHNCARGLYQCSRSVLLPRACVNRDPWIITWPSEQQAQDPMLSSEN